MGAGLKNIENLSGVDAVFVSVYSDIHCYNIRRLSAFLKKKGFTTRIIFLPQPFSKPYSHDVMAQMIQLCKGSKLICVSLMTNYWDNANQVTSEIRKNLDLPVIWGGAHPTIMPDECLEVVDMIGVCEGDDTLSILLKKIKEGDRNYADIPNLYYRKSGKIHKNKLERFDRMDEIPIPDFDLDEHFVLFGEKIHKMNPSLFRCFYGETYAIQCTFGCPYRCAYCCNNVYNKLLKFKFRKRRMDLVLEELECIKNRFKFINRIRIDDDSFFSNYSKEELEYFRDNYRERIGLPLMIRGGHPNTIKKEILQICIDAGMDRVGMGIQTGNENTKRLFNRMVSNESVMEACNTINSFKGLIADYDFILDIPWETDDDIIETLNFIIGLPQPYNASLFSLTFFPGTDLFERAISEKIIKDVKNEVYRKYYYGLENHYLTLLFPIFTNSFVPKRIKRFLIRKDVVGSKYQGLLIRLLGMYNSILAIKPMASFLLARIVKLDMVRTVYSVKKYYYDFVMNKSPAVNIKS